jgi:hypothetical protein
MQLHEAIFGSVNTAQNAHKTNHVIFFNQSQKIIKATRPLSIISAPIDSASILLPTHVFENKMAAQLLLSNQIDSRQSNLSTTVSKPGLTQWNQILKRRGDWSPFSKKTHISSSPAPASPNLDPPTPTVFEGASPYTQAPLQALGSQLSAIRYPLRAPRYQ